MNRVLLQLSGAVSAACLALSGLAGCGATLNNGQTGALTGGSAISYQASNVVFPNGYSEAAVGPDKYRVRATGDMRQSRAALEKLAMTRAADIGQSMNQKYFRVDAVSENVICGRRKSSGRDAQEIVIKPKRTVDLEVSFAKEQVDPSWLASKESFALMRGELDTLGAPDVPPEAISSELAMKCGGA
ncbi:MAG: hypothetical protein NW216_14710 [Hyphomicrobium sp.]|nr:hypothetical protein [Hyphomicrobium sp.]